MKNANAGILKPRQVKLRVSRWEREYVLAQQAVNRVTLYRPVYPTVFRWGLNEANAFMGRFAWGMQQRQFERVRAAMRAEWMARR